MKRILAIVMVLTMAFAACADLNPREYTPMPNLIGAKYRDAEKTLEALGFEVMVIRADPEVMLHHEELTRNIGIQEVFKINDITDPRAVDSKETPFAPDGKVILYYGPFYLSSYLSRIKDIADEIQDIISEPSQSSKPTWNKSVVIPSNLMFKNVDSVKTTLEEIGFRVTTVAEDMATMTPRYSQGLVDRLIRKGQVFQINDVTNPNYRDNEKVELANGGYMTPISSDGRVTLYYAKEDFRYEP
jgi:hypothetical protein